MILVLSPPRKDRWRDPRRFFFAAACVLVGANVIELSDQLKERGRVLCYKPSNTG